MSAMMPRLVLLAYVFCPTLSVALGLGEIHLNSALNEPLSAEIDLVAAAPDELTALRATLAGREVFTRYGIDRPPFLNSLTFKVGKGKSGREVLQVRSLDAIPEPFVTFLVEVNWARGHLMREYTVLLDPPIYTPGEAANNAAPVVMPSGKPAATKDAATIAPPVDTAVKPLSSSASSYRVAGGDSLSKIARSLQSGSAAKIDQTMVALYRANPDAFGGSMNILHKGSVLRVPGATEIAALSQSEAVSEVNREIHRSTSGTPGAAKGHHLRLVTPSTGDGAGVGNNVEAQALKDRVKILESQLAESHRLIDVRNAELSALQRKLGVPITPPVTAPVTPPVVAPPVKTPEVVKPSAVIKPEVPQVPVDTAKPQFPVPEPVPAPAVPKIKVKPVVAVPVETGSWIDWVAANWWWPLAAIAALLAGLGFASFKKRRAEGFGDLPNFVETDVADLRNTTSRVTAGRKGDDSFLVEESGEHKLPDAAPQGSVSDDTMSSESAVNLDQGDPLAEADFHMAYGLYDQASDLVRIALEREPDRRDLRLKLLEIYFVWGNKDLFLQTAKTLEASREHAPAGEWDKIVIMGKQICPDEAIFKNSVGGGRGAGALVDLNLEGGENRVDIDLFGDPEGEHSRLDHPLAHESADSAVTGEMPVLGKSSNLDFTLDAPERGADSSPTRDQPIREEPTVESEIADFSLTHTGERRGIATKTGSEQTAEVSIMDLGLDLGSLEETNHPADAPTMISGLDERSRQMMAAAAASASARDGTHADVVDAHAKTHAAESSVTHDQDLTELERELEASFVADLDVDHTELKTAVLSPESAPTVLVPHRVDVNDTTRSKLPSLAVTDSGAHTDIEATSRLRGLSGDSVDLDLDNLSKAFGTADTVSQPQHAEELFSTEVFEASQRSRRVDLDVGDVAAKTANIQTHKLAMPELEPVTMSEVGTKLDLARAYMDMGDPEGARSILDEVVHEGSASQKQEAQRLIETLPG